MIYELAGNLLGRPSLQLLFVDHVAINSTISKKLLNFERIVLSIGSIPNYRTCMTEHSYMSSAWQAAIIC